MCYDHTNTGRVEIGLHVSTLEPEVEFRCFEFYFKDISVSLAYLWELADQLSFRLIGSDTLFVPINRSGASVSNVR